MAYEDFLSEFARVQGVGTVDALMKDHSERYSFQINSRERARRMIDAVGGQSGIDFSGKRVLDVGCAYGSFAIELAKIDAKVVGIDISDKWLKLAEINARGEVDAKFLNCDASTYRARKQLEAHGPFDVFIVNDVFEHVYDTVGLMDTMRALSAPMAQIYFKVPNGQATRHVLLEGHKKVFGISLLAPDYWSDYISSPFHIYYRRWPYFNSIFEQAGFSLTRSFNKVTDPDIDATRRHIVNDVNKIRQHLKRENFDTARQYAFVSRACEYYFEEVDSDLEKMHWNALFSKYRVTFWEGILTLN